MGCSMRPREFIAAKGAAYAAACRTSRSYLDANIYLSGYRGSLLLAEYLIYLTLLPRSYFTVARQPKKAEDRLLALYISG